MFSPFSEFMCLTREREKKVWSKALAYSLLLMASDTSLDIVNSLFLCMYIRENNVYHTGLKLTYTQGSIVDIKDN